MKAIILSAGQGTRLAPLTNDRPKCLVEVASGTTLLGWQLSQLARAGVRETVVVTGYGAEQVDREVENYRDLLEVRTLYNPGFDRMDNLGSAWHARAEMSEDFLILNGDTVFDAPVAERLCGASAAPVRVTISRKDGYDDDDMKVALAGERLAGVGKQLDLDTVDAESIGMILFRGNGVDLFREAACEAMEGENPQVNRYYLSIIDALARKHRVDVIEAREDEWGEVDFPGDLTEARNRVRGWAGSAPTEPSAFPGRTRAAEPAPGPVHSGAK